MELEEETPWSLRTNKEKLEAGKCILMDHQMWKWFSPWLPDGEYQLRVDGKFITLQEVQASDNTVSER